MARGGVKSAHEVNKPAQCCRRMPHPAESRARIQSGGEKTTPEAGQTDFPSPGRLAEKRNPKSIRRRRDQCLLAAAKNNQVRGRRYRVRRGGDECDAEDLTFGALVRLRVTGQRFHGPQASRRQFVLVQSSRVPVLECIVNVRALDGASVCVDLDCSEDSSNEPVPLSLGWISSSKKLFSTSCH
ncbi:hypothetical protein HPB47_020748 [Ixodes persulcatus]|uniref:Uncharacterized protein n=1 Tax=Ixodes persulcatus TaxID=34615 RepID=A0AC60QEN6_IXOPE|nr:hypothetical protein HPB47_020748 [Ixodes persulcatus]